jgi:hypothetical protein
LLVLPPCRCIKPNNAKVANTFDSRMCIEQLTYAGVFEAVSQIHPLPLHMFKQCVFIPGNLCMIPEQVESVII